MREQRQYIHAVCACQNIYSNQNLVTYKRTDQPITVFIVRVNTAFGFINRIIPTEPKGVHINAATVSQISHSPALIGPEEPGAIDFCRTSNRL